MKHFYSSSAIMKEDLNRGIDLLSPVWNTFDLTPEGRGEWNASSVMIEPEVSFVQKY